MLNKIAKETIFSVQYDNITLNNLSDTERLGKNIISGITTFPTVVALTGPLGSGKTTLCKYLTHAYLNVDVSVVSPTFNILNIYTGKDKKVYHYDLYRVNNALDLIELGIEEALQGCKLILIEWPSMAMQYIKNTNVLFVEITTTNIARTASVRTG
ncbi:tRNA (adenosine(37)-N6)-threonylcarbamoyltransferase complex ATPase subunit type 1 TsaE [Candidatus Sneabacter namystus]|uniref:tRNA (adenosine(37)-N6)-threonylcarbamoyltransferase complex ATPase subunit type 1 TsaE n=1 Tax=Candidatus Sneabacter namystus TaxID=2601646 RepID=UPI00155A2C58|nr:tRNA (adenosine(37)-N6)-threonylcarbamoyltransferase complex ATPase subunit type 1 TsaE [Candidatus Sneabacter namystus]